jgi:alpha-D-ribose 1-methylphosphonate 5-triphosphate synthase subunit PhnI
MPRANRGGSLLLAFHSWRGFGRERDLFNVEVRMGFVTLAFARYVIGDRLRLLADRLCQIAERLK